MAGTPPQMIGLYLFVSDLEATKSFYQAFGLDIEPISDMFARATWSDKVMLEFGTKELTSSYDPNFMEPGPLSKSTINFELESQTAVDHKFSRLVDLGYEGHLAPIEAPWGARFAIVSDPDGNYVGLHSPRDRKAERKRESSDD